MKINDAVFFTDNKTVRLECIDKNYYLTDDNKIYDMINTQNNFENSTDNDCFTLLGNVTFKHYVDECGIDVLEGAWRGRKEKIALSGFGKIEKAKIAIAKNPG